jgi:hypothetical protein
MILAVPFVVVWSLLVLWIPELKVYAACWGIAVTLVDIFLFTPWQRSLKKKAAKIQELFDCNVLQLDWQDLKLGRRPDAETIVAYSSKFKRADPECLTVRDWYPVGVGKLPIQLARIVCQRANCWWDAELRRRYAVCVIISILVLTVIVFLIGLIGGLTPEKFFLVVIAPLMPAFTLGMRQYNEHNEAAAALDRLKEHAEDLWNKAISGEVTSEELARGSRNLQDEIYDHRRRSSLIFDWIYRRLRRAHEEQMNKGAEVLIDEALRRLKP